MGDEITLAGRPIEIADHIETGEMTTDKAVTEARKPIETNFRPL